jgi:desulfoferrodoxin (superoxide reductase-like protein)
MKKNKMLRVLFSVAILLFISVSSHANKTSVEVTAPEQAEKGSEITVIIAVKHMGNTPTHFTEWVTVKINGKEVKRWKYSKDERPEAGNFTLEYKFVLDEKSKIEVQGSCNKHGSAGAKNIEIDLK